MHITADQLDLLLAVTGADADPLSFFASHLKLLTDRETCDIL